MINRERNMNKRILVFLLVLFLCINLCQIMKNHADADTVTTYKFTSSLISGGGDLTAKFRIKRGDYHLTGLCRHGGPANSSSARATMTKLKRNDSRFYLAYYYGRVKGWTSGAKGCDLARAFNYATYGNAYHQSKEKSKLMINNALEYASKNPIPENFTAYDCDPTDGSQEFIAWYYAASGKLKLTKISTDTGIAKTGKYSFEGIQYKVYGTKSTKGKCYGTLTCSKNGSTNTIMLPADGFDIKKYYIRETKTNDYYKMSTQWYVASVLPNKTSTITVKDDPKYGTLSFTKKLTANSEHGSSLKGFKFTLTNVNNSSVKYSGVSDVSGNVRITDILIGTYVLKEELSLAQLQKGYKSISKSRTLMIKAGSNTIGNVNNYINERVVDKPELIIYKITDDGGPVDGWTFEVRNVDTGIMKTGKTDENGTLIFKDMPSGKYEVKEIMTNDQMKRYYQPDTQTKTLLSDDAENIVFTFENNAISKRVKIKKESDDGMIGGVEFEIKGNRYPGTVYESKTSETICGTTDENGYFDAGLLPPGDYVVEEIGFNHNKYINKYLLEGYSNPARRFSVTQNGVIVDGNEVPSGDIKFENKPYRIILEKKEILADGTQTDNPVEGAEYELYLISDGEESFIGTYVTDKNGRIEVFDVCPGDYRFYETSVPSGYMEKTDIHKVSDSIDDDTTVLRPEAIEFSLKSTGEGVIEVADTNRQKYGSVFIKKFDKDEYPVENAEFTLFTDESCVNYAKDRYGNDIVGTTDTRGYLMLENIPWNTYYLKETKAPRGYEPLEDVRKLIIGYDAEKDVNVTDYEIHVRNKHRLGIVELSKMNEEKKIIEEQAKYNLYTGDGKLVKGDLCTGQDNDSDGKPDGAGKIKVSGLEWGNYYFVEVEAPTGYSISDEKIRFTVNAFSAGTVQKVNAIDKLESTFIVATKKILAEDIYYDHGVPAFTFNLKGTDIGGNIREYNRNVVFSEAYVREHTGVDGYVSLSATFSNIPAGTYELTEAKVLRYVFEKIETTSLVNGYVNGETVEFDLRDGEVFGAATFINRKQDWRNYSDTGDVTNIVKKQKLYTALKAEYNGKILDGNMPVADFNEYLDVYAIYDDGSERKLMNSEYTVRGIDGNDFDRTPKVPGYYTLTVTYSEEGITCTDIIELQVAPPQRITVHFEVNGGSALADMQVWKYDTLSESTNNKMNYTTERQYYNFVGWFEDAGLSKAFSAEENRITENITLYANWNSKHLNEYSWSELAEISSGEKAKEVLEECFKSAKLDIADGRLDSYEHTKAFKYGGKTIHAMITGFDEDVDSKGNFVGISFMTYEAAGTAALNTLETNVGGWEESELRESLNSSIDTMIADTQLKNNMKEVKRLSAAKNDRGEYSITTTFDKLAVPSQMELSGVYGFNSNLTAVPDIEYGSLKSLQGEGKKYSLFNDIIPDGYSNGEKALGRGYTYWTRSIAVGTNGFCTVLPNGAFSFTGN